MPNEHVPAAAPGLPISNRRGFLRGLTTLPLIGGGVTLIGAPTAVAEPVTEGLLDSYDAWLAMERRYLKWERYGNTDAGPAISGCECVWYDPRSGQVFDYIPGANGGHRYHFRAERSAQPQPSSRAALVLATVGCDWREGDR